jgi:hypothetical protein
VAELDAIIEVGLDAVRHEHLVSRRGVCNLADIKIKTVAVGQLNASAGMDTQMAFFNRLL